MYYHLVVGIKGKMAVKRILKTKDIALLDKWRNFLLEVLVLINNLLKNY